MTFFTQILSSLLVISVLAGCGGGGSASDDTQQSSNTNTQNTGSTGSSGNTSGTSNETADKGDTGNTGTGGSTATPTGFQGKRSYSTTDGYFVDISGMAISSCSGNCFVVRGGEIIADKKAMIVATKDKNWNIVRLNSDGKTIDTSFAANGVLSVSGISNVPQYGWEIDDTQRILVLTKDYWNVQRLSRYNADGTLDTTFATGGTLTYPPVNDPTNLLMLQDGRILIGGSYTAPLNNLSGESQWAFTLLTEAGAKDSALPQDGYFVVSQPNPTKFSELRKVVETSQYLYLMGTTGSNGFAIGRLNKADFSVDTNFGTNGFVEVVESKDAVINDLLVDSKGRIVAVGSVLNTGQVNVNNAGMAYAVYRYLADGSVDTSFDSDGVVLVDFGFSTAQTHQINDSAISVFEKGTKLIVTGQSGSTTGSTGRAFSMVRLLESGTIDDTFEIGDKRLEVNKHSSSIYFSNITSSANIQSVILDNQQGRLVGYGVITDKYGNINTTTPLRVQWWD